MNSEVKEVRLVASFFMCTLNIVRFMVGCYSAVGVGAVSQL